jgi:hypothetical protein
MLAQAAENPALLKLMLASEGVSIPSGGLDLSTIAVPNSATAMELMLAADIWVRARINPRSSFRLLKEKGGDWVRDDSAAIPVRIVPEPAYASVRNDRGAAFGEIVSIRGSYAVVTLGGGCGLNQPGQACAICLGRELTHKAGELWPVDEVVEGLRGAFEEGAAEFVHFRLGYFPGDDAGLYFLRPYLDAIHRHFDTIVAVTMHPPASLRLIDLTYAAGVDVVAYNLEAGDDAAMRRHFPGRVRFFGRERYLKALRHAANVFPNGAVWCELLFDLNSVAEISQAIEELTSAGVMPLLAFSRCARYPASLDEITRVMAQLYHAASKAGLGTTWTRDLSTAITPMEARYFVRDAPQLPVIFQMLTRNRLGALTTRSLARMRRRLRVKRVRASFDSSRL